MLVEVRPDGRSARVESVPLSYDDRVGLGARPASASVAAVESTVGRRVDHVMAIDWQTFATLGRRQRRGRRLPLRIGPGRPARLPAPRAGGHPPRRAAQAAPRPLPRPAHDRLRRRDRRHLVGRWSSTSWCSACATSARPTSASPPPGRAPRNGRKPPVGGPTERSQSTRSERDGRGARRVSRGSEMAVASVVIPAHNEAATIGRNLRALREGTGADLDVVVVCNGCTDRTADEARAADPSARVIEIPQPSKVEAVRVGNAATDVFPRIHLDADIELNGRGRAPAASSRSRATRSSPPPRDATSPARGARAGCGGTTTSGRRCPRWSPASSAAASSSSPSRGRRGSPRSHG